MDHRTGRAFFALVVGLLVAGLSYQWITNPDGREQRELQEEIVHVSRGLIRSVVGADDLEIVDALSPDRRVGKAYVYPEGKEWAVSGFYRRPDNDRWHPYLMTLGADSSLKSLKLQDTNSQLVERAASDPLLEISP